MVKLVVSDIDGTLFDTDRRLPPDFDYVIERLKELGIYFVLASGRTYKTILRDFEKYKDYISFICDNGACIVCGGKVVYESILSHSDMCKAVTACDGIPGLEVSLCGVRSSYHVITPENANSEVIRYHAHYTAVDSLLNVDDDIYKIAIFDKNEAMLNSMPRLKNIFGDRFTMQVSGKYWMDIMHTGTDKGYALKFIQNRLGISVGETMAFGDYYNDIPMLRRAEYGFVMANAGEDIKQYGKYIAESNKRHGVTRALRSFFGI